MSTYPLTTFRLIMLKLVSMEKEAFLKKLGERIVSIRQSKGLSQSDLAHLCFKERQSIERVENGKINPSAYYLHEIATALDVSLGELLDF